LHSRLMGGALSQDLPTIQLNCGPQSQASQSESRCEVTPAGYIQSHSRLMGGELSQDPGTVRFDCGTQS
jgi:hypothetical protein